MGVRVTEKPSINNPYFTHPEFRIKGRTDFVLQFGAKHSSIILIENSAFADGDTITFEWGANSITLTIAVATTPSDIGTLFYQDTSVFDQSANEIFLLARDFDIFVSYFDPYFTTVEFYAREFGSQYNLLVTNSIGAISYLSSNDGEDILLDNTFNVLCDIFKDVGSGVEYSKLGTIKSSLNYNPDAPLVHFSFDFTDFIYRTLSYEDIRYEDATFWHICTLSCAKFKFNFYQSSGWVGNAMVANYIFLKGGLTYRDYMRTSKDYFSNYSAAEISVLRNYIGSFGSLFFTCTKNQILYTSIFIKYPLLVESYVPVLMISDVFGNTHTVTLMSMYSTLYCNNKFHLRMGYNDLNIDSIATTNGLGPIVSFSLSLRNYTTTDTFILGTWKVVDNDYREIYFVYVNSLGGLQPIKTIGEYEIGIEIEKEEFEKEVATLTNIVEDFMVSETYRHIFKGDVFSGWLEKADALNFLDLLNSEKIWIQDDKRYSLTPVKILKGSYRILRKSNDGIMQFGFNFKYVETTNDKHITDLLY